MNKNLDNRKVEAQKEREKLAEIADKVIKCAKNKGASAAEVGVSSEVGLSTTVRLQEVDTIEFNQDKGVGVTVYFGYCRAFASTSDTSDAALEATVQAACDIAKVTEEDPCFGLPDKDLLAFNYPDLDLYHPWDVSPDQTIDLAKRCEQHALELDKRIINSEGATVNTHQSHSVYANTLGFVGQVSTTRHSISCVLVAKDSNGMQRDYDYTTSRDPASLVPIEDLAQKAVRRTVDRLNAKKLTTQKMPVIFAAEIASNLLSALISGVSGSNLYRKSSFLLDKLGEQIFPEFINIYERPYLTKALGSSAFDADGVRTVNKHFIKDGVLASYALGTYSARRLGLQPTGNAGGVFNLIIEPGADNLAQLLQRMDTGVIVTELMGHGVNIITGDYSRGAVGFWVEKGVIQYAVEEFTIASNLKDMFRNIIAVANDVDLRKNIRSGSILIEEMTIAGS